MKSSMFNSLGRLAMAALLASSFLAAGACNKDTDSPGTGTGSGTSTPVVAGKLTMSIVVNAPDVQNRRTAAVRFETTTPMPEGQLAFEIPEGCRIVAGAAVRPVRKLGEGPVSQELQFECPPGTSGVLKATFRGTDNAGTAIEQSVDAAL